MLLKCQLRAKHNTHTRGSSGEKKYQYGPIPSPFFFFPSPPPSSAVPTPSLALPLNQLGGWGRTVSSLKPRPQMHVCDILSPENAFGGNKTAIATYHHGSHQKSGGMVSGQPKKC